MERIKHDGVLIVGAGLAGLAAALAAAPRKALVLTGAPLSQGCSSAWAQGGMAAALGSDDAPDLHAADTVAGEAARNVPGHARNVPGHGLRRVDSSQGRARPSTPPAPMNGPSMGAMTVVYLAAQYPDHFAA